jgi:hypothetical protein
MGKLDQIRALREVQYAERETAPASMPVSYAKPVTNTVSVTNSVTNNRSPGAGDAKTRVARWRAANPERYRTYMRNLMRTIRAKQKEAHA